MSGFCFFLLGFALGAGVADVALQVLFALLTQRQGRGVRVVARCKLQQMTARGSK